MATHHWIGSTGTQAWTTTGNWDSGVVPTTGDVAVVRNSTSLISAADQSAVTLAALIIERTFTGTIGSAAAYFQIGATKLEIGGGIASGSGSARIKLNLGTAQTTASIYASASTSADSGFEPVRLIGTHASNVIDVYGGNVGIGTTSYGEASTVATLNVYGGTVNVGNGVTLTTLNQTAGTAYVQCAATTITQTGGTLTTLGSGAVTTATVGGTFAPKSTGTITTLDVINGGNASFSGAADARTVTNCSVQRGGTLTADRAVVTFTNGVDLPQCKLSQVTLDLGINLTVTPSAI